ncbi:MAG: efflux RND transporter periplasmic adaptor subunit [Paracoccaceae bacterium]
MSPVSITSLLLPIALALTPAAPGPALAQTAAAEAATEPAPAVAETLPAISITMAEPRKMTDRVIASGLIGPIEEVMVQPLIEGQPIESLLADVGDRVQEGQVLATLSKTTLELQRAQATASLASSRATIAQAEAQLVEAESSAAEAGRVAERTAKLREQGSASQAAADTANANAVSATARVTVARQTLEAARAQLALSEAQLANVELQLTRTEVKAPVSGVITARNAALGAIATAATAAMFVMEKDGALELRADIAESDLLRLGAGQTARLTAVGLSETISGTIRLIEPAIDVVTRLGRARIEVADPAGLRAGMFVEAEILVAERETLAVPVTAVGSDNGDTTVMRVRDGVVERVVVTTGIRDAGYIEVLSGLARGDQIVAKAASFVRDGDRINPVPLAATN